MSYYNDPYTAAPQASATPPTGVLFFDLAIFVVVVVMMWKIFTKAGQAGWKSIIPIYNTYVLLKIVGRPWWWLLLLLVPLVNIVVAVIVAIDLAKSFGRSTAFGVFLVFFLSIIGYAILAFGKDTYRGPSAGGGSNPAPPAPAPGVVPPAA